MHPGSHGGEVVTDGKHHDGEEHADLNAGEVQRVLELQLKVAVISLI